MRNKKKKILKMIVMTLIILASLLVVLFKHDQIISWAVTMYSAKDATARSLRNPITVRSWQERILRGGYSVVTHYETNSLGSNPGLGVEDLHGYANVLCTGLNVTLRGRGECNTWVRFEHLATPTEAWILAELEYSDGTKPLTYEDTEELFDGDEEDLNEYYSSGEGDDKITIYAVGASDTFVRQRADGKYYYVRVTGSAYGNIQDAWWNASPRQHKSRKEDPSGLAAEAKEFEKYVREVGHNEPTYMYDGCKRNDTLEEILIPYYDRNEDGTFKIDYRVGIEPEDEDVKKLKVTFDASKNKYRMGPIKVYYDRRVTQQAERPRVDFCGMTHIILVGVDAEGNELLDESGESVFVQNSNFKVLFKDQEAHESTAASYGDTDATYPFPYNGEEFYIEFDYMDDLYAIKSCKFDFHYMTAKGSYEEYHGKLEDSPYDNSIPDRQPLSNATGPNERIDVDAFGRGLLGERGNTPAELDLIPEGGGDDEIPVYTSLGGMVWIDKDPQKIATSGKIGLYDGDDKVAPANSVEIVVWKVKYQLAGSSYKEIEREKAIAWTSAGEGASVIDFINNRIYIDSKGEYKIPVIQVPSEEGLDTSKYRMAYDVEFIYDGQTYEATEFLVPDGGGSAGGSTKSEIVNNKLKAFYKTAAQTKGKAKDYTEFAKSSYAIENADDRKDFDSYFTEVYGGNPIDTTQVQGELSDGSKDYNKVATKGYATGGAGGSSQYGREEYGEGVGSGQQVEASLEYNAQLATADGDGSGDAAKTKSELITHDADGFIYDQFKFAARVSESGLKFPYEEKYHIKETEDVIYDNIKMLSNTYKPIYEYCHQINLGLLERERSDISVVKDLYTANVVVNEHLSTYHYNKLGEVTDEALKLQETLGFRKQKYNIDLYNSDYYYRSSAYKSIEDEITKELVTAVKDNTELQLFLTYRIQFTNESSDMNVSINEFKDYYDSTFTLITNEICSKKDEDGNEVASDDGQFKKYISSLKKGGDDNATEVSREPRTVATSPYYRKLTYKPNPSATVTSEGGASGNAEYYWNREEDLDSSKVSKIEAVAKNVEVEIGEDKGGYHTFKFNGLAPVGDINSGKLSSGTALVIEPNETIEFFVSYQVDTEGFKKASEADSDTGSVESSQNDAAANEGSVQDGKLTEAAEGTIREKLTGSKNNIVEITRYSTGYTLKNGSRHKTTSYSKDNISGRVDQDSAPDNLNTDKITEFKYTEDDTEYAPTVQVSVIVANESRKLDGTVWEDSRNKEGDTSVGNGILDSGEKGIDGIDVSMVEKIRVTKKDLENKGYDLSGDLVQADMILDNEFEYLWRDNQIPGFTSKTTSGGSGAYSFTNFPTGTFVVRFEYGNDDNVTDLKYNGQDYKNTAYQIGMTNPSSVTDKVPKNTDEVPTNSSDMEFLAGKSTLNNEWHDLSSNDEAKRLENTRVSDARDYEPQRMRVIAYSRTLTNKNAEILSSNINNDIANLANENNKTITTQEDEDNKVYDHTTDEYEAILSSDENKQEFIANTRMVANTAKLFIDVEKQDSVSYKTVATTEGNSSNDATAAKSEHEYVVKNIDFGLVERPETRINVQKEIKKIQLTKNDGQEVILSVECDEAGNIIKAGGSAEDSIRVEKVVEIHKNELAAGQGFKYIAMESSFLKGLQVKLTYNISIVNNSEVDYISSGLANVKNVQTLYDLTNNFENADTERLYSDGMTSNTVPFISGKGIIYGRYLGAYYYTNDIQTSRENTNAKYSAGRSGGNTSYYDRYYNEEVVTTTVDQLVDYVDNDLSISIADTENYENQVWTQSSIEDRVNKLSEVAYEKGQDGKYTKDDKMLQDDKERAYVTDTNNNISVSVNSTMTEKPVEEIKYGKIVIANTDEQTSNETQTKATEQKPTETGTLDPSTGTIKEETKKQLKFINYRTNDKVLKYIYTTIETGNANAIDTYNPRLTVPLIPQAYKDSKPDDPQVQERESIATISIVTSVQANEEAINNMNYDNLVEIAMYSNAAGRRDMQAIPGNANLVAKDKKAYEAGYNRIVETDGSGNVVKNGEEIVYKWQAKEVKDDTGAVIMKTERDAYAARDTVTFSEPTGVSLQRLTVSRIINVILVALIVAAVTVIVITITMVLKKTRVDDEHLLKNEDNN